MSNREIKPKKFTPNAISDSKSVGIVKKLLPEDKFYCDIKENDKIPNEDGIIQCLDPEGYPLGKIEVQVKTMSQTRTKLAHSLELEILAYAKEVQLPFILIVVDQIKEVAYWIELDRASSIKYIDKALEKNVNQNSISIDLHEDKELSKSDLWENWCGIINRQKQTLSDGQSLILELESKEHDLKIISEQLDNQMPEKDAKFIPINLFQEKLNQLINGEFQVIKKVYRDQFWKFGINLYTLTEREIFYGLFRIMLSDNEKPIRQFKVNESQYIEQGMVHPFSRGYGGRNPIIESPESHAYERCKEFLEYLFKYEILWPKSIIFQEEFIASIKSQNFKDFDELDQFSLEELKTSIENFLGKLPRQKTLMEKYPELKFNLFRALDYIQNLRLEGKEYLDTRSNVRNSIKHLHLSFCNNQIFPVETEAILVSFWRSVIAGYDAILNEYFEHFRIEMRYHKEFVFELLVPISFQYPDGIDLKLARIVYFQLAEKPKDIEGQVSVENDFNAIERDWENQSIKYRGQTIKLVYSGCYSVADLARDELPIRNRAFEILKTKMKQYFEEKTRYKA